MPELQTITTVAASVEQNERPPATASSIRIKTPRRILHFSDGTMEEYSTDDEPDASVANQTNQQTQVNIVRWQLCVRKYCVEIEIQRVV